MPHITHISRMDTMGGIERLLQAVINHPDQDFSHALFLTGRKIHPALRPDDSSIPIRYSRYAGGIYIPRPLRRHCRDRALSALNPNIISFWGYPTTDHDQMKLPSMAQLVYQEHGSCWDMEATLSRKQFLNRMSGITCCSFAARRMLELSWDCQAPITVVKNPVPPHALPPSAQPKTLSLNRPLIIGTAGRLVPYKATVLGFFVLKSLLDAGLNCRLRIAGTGTLFSELKQKASELNIQPHIDFEVEVANMPSFYQGIDIFLLPSIREPLGLVAVEAMASGCPVIATSVDGIPEAIIDGQTGFCIQPDMTIKDYLTLVGQEFGGKFPEAVYDPPTDQLRSPLATNPNKLANAVQKLITDPVLYGMMSRNALEVSRRDFSFNSYYSALKTALLHDS